MGMARINRDARFPCVSAKDRLLFSRPTVACGCLIPSLLLKWFHDKFPKELQYFMSSQELKVREVLSRESIKSMLSFLSILCMNKLGAEEGSKSKDF